MASSHRDEISRLELLHAAHPDGLVFPHLADAYRRAGRYAQAETVLEAGLRRHSEYSSAHVVLGRLRMDQGDPVEAETAFRRVLQLDPQNQIALQHLGDMAAAEGRLSEALSYYRKLGRLKPDPQVAARVAELEQRVSTGAAAARAAAGNGQGRAGTGANGSGAAAARPGVEDPRPGAAGADRETIAPRPAARSVPEPGEVVTETMAELYARQGLHRRAAAVYRQLLERNPADARLRAKLEEVEGMATGHRRPHESVGGGAGERPQRTGAHADTAVDTDPEVDPDPRVEPGNGSIREQLRAILSWRPRPAEPARPRATEPVDAAEAPEPSGDPEARTGEPGEPTGEPTGPRDEPTSRVGEPTSRVGEPTSRTGEPTPPPAPRPEVQSASADPWREHDATTYRAPARTAPAADVPVRTHALIALTDMLVGLLEYRDPFFRGSSSLTRLLAASVAEEMGLSEEEQVDLSLAAVLRDVGRLALGGKLVAPVKIPPSHEARRRIERHVDLALHLMEGIQLPEPVRQAVRHHHERWDGAGYPDALSGETIPVLARILAVVDSFAAMVSPRPYRLPRKVPEAAAELQEEAGTRYDPEVVNALIRVLARRDQPHLGFVQRHHILLVNPDHPGALVTAAKLCSAGYLAEVAVDPATARERLRRVPVAALVVSAENGDEAVASFIRELRGDALFSALPVVVVDAPTVGLRVRLLESGADVCFPPGVRHDELQGTVGALVRRTLRAQPDVTGPEAGAEAPWLALQGDIQDFPLTWLLQVMKYDSRTAGIGIRTATREGAIYLRGGDAVHAEIRGGGTGEGALREMLQWRKGRFTVQPDARPRQQTISASIMHLLLTQAVDEDHAAAGVFGAVSADG